VVIVLLDPVVVVEALGLHFLLWKCSGMIGNSLGSHLEM